LVIKTNDPSDPALVKYLADRGWRTNTDKTRFSKVRVIVNWIVGIVGGIGLVMLLFGMLVFSLFIQLTIASSRPDIELLKTIGTSPKALQSFLMQQFMPVNGVVMLTVMLLLSGIQYAMHHILAAQQMNIAPFISWVTVAAMFLVMLLVWLTNRSTVRRYLRS
jgi:cell division protein FtsX